MNNLVSKNIYKNIQTNDTKMVKILKCTGAKKPKKEIEK